MAGLEPPPTPTICLPEAKKRHHRRKPLPTATGTLPCHRRKPDRRLQPRHRGFTTGIAERKMNLSAICRRVGLKEFVSAAPIYSGISDASEGLSLMIRRWATKKTAGSTKNGRDSKPKHLGVKKFGGERVIPGNIIIRQRGTRFHPGDYVGMGKDHTLYALKEGNVRFERHKLSGRKWVHVDPKEGHLLHPVYANAAEANSKIRHENAT